MHAVAAVLASAVLASLPAASAPADQVPAPGTYTIRVQHSGKCLDVRGSSTAERAVIVQNTCDGRASQRFSVSYPTRVREVFSVRTFTGMCWRRTGGEGYPNTLSIPIGQYACNDSDLEYFGFRTSPGAGGLRLHNVSFKGEERLCLHVLNVSTADDTEVITYLCNFPPQTGHRNDTYTFQPA